MNNPTAPRHDGDHPHRAIGTPPQPSRATVRQLTDADLADAAMAWDRFVQLPFDERLHSLRPEQHRTVLAQQRFLSRIRQRPDGCWEWRGPVDQTGHAIFRVHGRLESVARAAYLLFVGPIPWAHDISTACGSRCCARPGHVIVAPKAST